MRDIPAWFVGAHLHWAENMLTAGTRPELLHKNAIISCREPTPTLPLSYACTTHSELRFLVARAVLALRALGVGPGDRVCYYGATCTPCLVALLATTAIGAIWSSSGADLGSEGAAERFGLIEPKVLITVNAVVYNRKTHKHIPKAREVVQKLRQSNSELKVVVVEHIPAEQAGVEELDDGWLKWEELLAAQVKEGTEDGDIEFWQGEFDAPLWVLFSSGTTGKPKAIVHRAGGMLLQSLKEHILHGDMTPEDVFFYYTTPGWMMLNYLFSGLATGATLVLFDGAPLSDHGLLWRIAEETGMTIFGTSAKYISELASRGYSPKEKHDTTKIRQVLSTGSPLKAELFDWVYENVGKDLLLGSITGGTDICSLFMGHCAILPVYRGEIQCITLGMAIQTWSDDLPSADATPQHPLPPSDAQQHQQQPGPTPIGEAGELVCVRPFVCMPVAFWGDDQDRRKYRAAYFSEEEGDGSRWREVWRHGDFCVITPSRDGNGGGVVMLGRSDGVLNPGGIRFGSAEIYDCLETPHFRLRRIEDSLVVGMKTADGADERVVLFLKLAEGAELSDELVKEVKVDIRSRRSARHVPDLVLQVKAVPHTINGKRVEIPIKKLLNGARVEQINRATLANPGCLGEYVEIGEKLRKDWS